MPKPKYKPATPSSVFEKRTPILPGVVADTVMEQRGMDYQSPEGNWFSEYVDHYVRWLHANKPDWKRKLEKSRDPRPFIYSFVNHWLDSYLKDPKRFVAQAESVDLGYYDGALGAGKVDAWSGLQYLGNMGTSSDPLGEEGSTFVWLSVGDKVLHALHVINMYYTGSDTNNKEETCIIEMYVDIREFRQDKDLLRGFASFSSLKVRDVAAHPEYHLADLNAYTDRFDGGHRCFDTFKDAAKFLVDEGVPRDELAMYL